ncbi:hypothetical protein [Cohnella rhizosphaerae]|uniref:Uncharacterized protein n=1 Tax=Cohnella rhizosphaerae TaxID=1457232 RepID=A0A9X4KRC5_9BACL|nr:hypothetical protein [Cohnella rhizosphaerae]MDG0808801.1 hypothetical protein [Cohnella rhizosphaerae]
MLGITFSSVPRPLMVAWWSACFPGFGHFVINQYARGVLFTLTEMLVNKLCRLNDAIVYTFCGRFDDAAEVLDPNWAFGYATIYLFAVWDSYRGAKYQGSLRSLSDGEAPIRRMRIYPLEVQYIERKNPLTGIFLFASFPGTRAAVQSAIRLGLLLYVLVVDLYRDVSRAGGQRRAALRLCRAIDRNDLAALVHVYALRDRRRCLPGLPGNDRAK